MKGKTGVVWLVGAGPGDPGLLTLRGREVLGRADVVVHDRLANPALLRLAPRAQLIDVGKRPEGGGHGAGKTPEGGAGKTAEGRGYRQEDINRLLIALAREGKVVVRLKGGDPFIFGRGGEEALALAEAGVPFRVVPGVTAASGCAAWAGVPLTHRGLASSLTLVTGHEDPDKPSRVDWKLLARGPDTLVVYMGAGQLDLICSELLAAGRSAEEPALLVQEGTRARQKVVSSRLAELPARAREAGVGPPVLLMVGKVASLREKLSWYEDLPLAGCRVALTRPGGGLPQDWDVGEWELAGAEVNVYRLFRLEPPDDPAPLREAARCAGRFAWILFTSAPGVEAFFAALVAEGGDARSLAGCRVGAVGPGTGAALRRRGIVADLVPDRHTVDALVEEVCRRLGPGDAVLLPRSSLAPPQAERLRQAGAGEVREVEAYRAVPDGEQAARLARDVRAGAVDVLVLTSASAARVAATHIGPGGDLPGEGETGPGERVPAAEFPLVVAIGPVAAGACREVGWPVAAVAPTHDRAGVLEALIGVWRGRRGPARGAQELR